MVLQLHDWLKSDLRALNNLCWQIGKTLGFKSHIDQHTGYLLNHSLPIAPTHHMCAFNEMFGCCIHGHTFSLGDTGRTSDPPLNLGMTKAGAQTCYKHEL